MHAAVRSVAAPPTRAEVLNDLGVALRPFGGWPWGRDLAWAADHRSEFLRAQTLRRDLKRTVLPGLRLLLAGADAAQRAHIADGVVALVRRCHAGLPALGSTPAAMALLAESRKPDASDRLLAWIVSEICDCGPDGMVAGQCAFAQSVQATLLRVTQRRADAQAPS